jgi:hypothetical protein
MEPRNACRTARLASSLALFVGTAEAILLGIDPLGPAYAGLAVVVAFALAPTLAVLASWRVPSRRMRLALIAAAMLVELPGLATSPAAAILAVCLETLLLVTLLATPFDRRSSPRRPERELSVVL